MDLQSYPIKYYKRKENAFEFFSKGVRNVLKVVELQETDQPSVYNLAMADMVDGKLSYSNITNNKDTIIVMQTVAHIVQVFTSANPKRYVFVKGDTDVKTRLYQMYLSNNLNKVQEYFKVWGGNVDGTGFEKFRKDKNYGGFLVKKL